ncbi:MAG: threonine--tRNA ligase [Verrucomicrobia bacterium GWC2_42_7]|nr:MAG: threonine--tRNA ligase [Verrucomicrobia bacterium GWC2_42_7]
MKEESLHEIRHSAAHVLAAAVMRLFPDTKIDIGPATDSGFYYDFDVSHKLTLEDLPKIEQEMKKIIDENQKFECKSVSREEAYTLFSSKNQGYKLERLKDIPEGETVTLYTNGDFTDLCRGPHVSYSKKIKAFKLTSIAGAYFKGNENNKQLQRIYGTAFADKADLEAYLNKIEEAKKRDHRKLGKEMQLFHIDDMVGQGLILWTPNGAIIRQELQNFITEELKKQNYDMVFTPHIGKLDLYRTSGHFPYYKESQFTPIVDGEEMQTLAKEKCCCAELSNRLDEGTLNGFLLKPMNCPMHIKIYDSQPRSYRELPVRLAEFGTVYRWEQSGELNGLTRVRGFTQDDAHLFCTEEQIPAEVGGCLKIVKFILTTLGMNDYRVRIGLRDPNSQKYIGKPENWEKAEEALRQAASTLGVPFSQEPGEAAFYGPKIDFVVKDVLGRDWQLGTVQIDYNLPERFNLSYTGSDNQLHRPVMIHRAPFGSMERFCGVLIEHFGGNFPTWLAPEQVRILPINDDLIAHSQNLAQKMKEMGIRVAVDDHSDKLNAKIRRGELAKVPYMFVIGNKKKETNQVSIRSRINKKMDGSMPVEQILEHIKQEIINRTLPC